MLGNKNHLLGIAILLIASGGLYYGTRTEEDKLASAMESAVEDHEREEALIYASKLLELQPGHLQAKRVIAQSVAIFTQLQAAREGLSEFWNRSNPAPLDAETLYRGLQESRKHLAKAKNIDAAFETTLEFEEKLDEAQAQLLSFRIECPGHRQRYGIQSIERIREDFTCFRICRIIQIPLPISQREFVLVIGGKCGPVRKDGTGKRTGQNE